MAAKQSREELAREYEMLSMKQDVLQKQIELLNNLVEENKATLDTLDVISSQTKGEGVLIPLGSGSYAYGTLENSGSVLVNMGAETLSRKSISDAKRIIEGRKSEIDEALKQASTEMNKIRERAMELEVSVHE